MNEMQPAQGNPNLAMFANMTQGGAPGAMPPQGMPQQGAPPSQAMLPPGGMPQPGIPQPPPPMLPPNMQGGQGGQGEQNRFTPQEMAALGRYGDTIVAHLTPGEIAVPPQVQTPKVLATLNKAFKDKDVSPQHFTAGSPQSSVNPQTGVAEYNFLSSFLPIALGLAGSAFMPGLFPALSPALAGALGGGLGTAAGGLIGGQSPMQAILSGAGAGAGGYLLGNLANPASQAAGSAAGQAAAPTAAQQLAAQAPFGSPAEAGFMNKIAQAGAAPIPAAAAAQSAPGLANLWGALPQDINPMRAVGSALGGMAGSAMGAPTVPQSPNLPSGFHDHFPSANQLPSWQDALGQGSYKGPNADFTNFDPATNFPAAHNFYPIQMPATSS